MPGSVNYGDLYFKVDTYEQVHLTFYDGTYSEVDLEDKVDIIDEYAFAYMKGIPHKCISETMWGCHIDTPLMTVKSDTVKKIGEGSFSMSFLKRAIFPSVKKIGSYAFFSCCLEEFESDSVKKIGEAAFADNESLMSVSIPNAGTLYKDCFMNCISLNDIDVHNVHKLYLDVFKGCNNLTNINIPRLNEIKGDKSISYDRRFSSTFPIGCKVISNMKELEVVHNDT